MKTLGFILALVTLAGCCFFADEEVTVVDPWIRAAPPNVPMAGYMGLQNNTDTEIALVAASSPMFSSIEFHRSVEKDGVYRMIRKTTLDISAQGILQLKPGDFHLMLFNARQRLQEGDSVEITLEFDNGSSQAVMFDVLKSK